LPAGHELHELLPLELDLPAEHELHELYVWPDADWYLPAWHDRQLVPDRYWPDEHVLGVQSCSFEHAIL
jgi:hypothetical protein